MSLSTHLPSLPIRGRTLVLATATVGVLTALAVPVVEACHLARTARPDVPGPHDQNGTVGAFDPSRPCAAVQMIWLGDSLASGVGATCADSSFPRRAAARFGAMDRRSVELTCLAQPGAVTADVLAHQVPAAVSTLRAGGVAVITVGSNDVGTLTRPWRFRRDYTLILEALLGTGATVVAVGLPDISAAAVMAQPLRSIAGWVGRRADARIQTLAAGHGAHYVDINTRPPKGTRWQEFLAEDRWHPNGDTYHLWADRVAPVPAPPAGVQRRLTGHPTTPTGNVCVGCAGPRRRLRHELNGSTVRGRGPSWG